MSRLLAATDPESRDRAWAAFVQAYSRLLLQVARSFGAAHDPAMDRYAFILEQLRRDDFRRLRGYLADHRAKFSTWLVVVARRLCLDHSRQLYGRSRASGEGGGARDQERAIRRRLVDLVAEEVDLTRQAPARGANPEEELRASELRQALASAVDQLKARDRLLVRLRFDDERSAREIARIMGFPTPFHVYRRLNVLLTSLRRTLRTSGIEDSVP